MNNNKNLAKIFRTIADYLKMRSTPFKPAAYVKAAIAMEDLGEDVKIIYKKGGVKSLEKISGIGKSIALKIEEYIKTGKIKYYEDLKKKIPINLEEITRVEGIGPKQAEILYQKLKIRNIKELEKMARNGKISSLFGFGEKKEKNILEGIKFLKRSKGRFLLGEIMPEVEILLERLKKIKSVKKVDVAGSVRRMRETIGDIDILVVSDNPEEVMDFFVSQPKVIKIWGKGKTRSSIRVKDGFDVDLRIVSKKSYGSALQYFTGSKEHNIATRKIAIKMGLKLNEYGVFKNENMIAGETEEDVYKAIGLQWIPPEMRTNSGEIELALKNKLPKLIGYDDIKGDLHCHSDWNGGKNSIFEMAESAQKMGYEYLGISDHTKFLRIENGLDEKQLYSQRKEIDTLNKKFLDKGLKFRILQGAETNILNNGSVDIKDNALKKLDYAIAGIHSNLKMKKGEMTERIIKAMKNPNINIIAHPTGRIIKQREAYKIDFDKILRAAKEFDVVLEINSSPDRLDLRDYHIRMAKKEGVKMIINTDSHHKNQLNNVKFGIAQARRGWAEKKDIINTQSLDKLLKFFK